MTALKRSAFFHVGLNRKEARKRGEPEMELNEGRVKEFKHFPFKSDHKDPDIKDLTYGDDKPSDILLIRSLEEDDVAWLIGSVTDKGDLGYYVLYGWPIEATYYHKGNTPVPSEVPESVKNNAHYKDPMAQKRDWAVLHGKNDLCANKPNLRISDGSRVRPWLKEAMGIHHEAAMPPKWWKCTIFSTKVTQAVLEHIVHHSTSPVS